MGLADKFVNWTVLYQPWFSPDKVPSKCLSYTDNETAIYSNLIRPVFNVSESISVDFQTSLIQILEVNEHDQYMVSLLSTRISWLDQFLTWRPDMNGNITDIVIPASTVWTPDIYLWNSVFEEFNSFYDGNVILDYRGNIVWLVPGVMKSACPVNMLYFPFDTQIGYISLQKRSGSKINDNVTIQSHVIYGSAHGHTVRKNWTWSIVHQQIK